MSSDVRFWCVREIFDSVNIPRAPKGTSRKVRAKTLRAARAIVGPIPVPYMRGQVASLTGP
jgi:hypothetical protein